MIKKLDPSVATADKNKFSCFTKLLMNLSIEEFTQPNLVSRFSDMFEKSIKEAVKNSARETQK